MSFFEFPHTRTYDTDLGWLIKQCKTVSEAVDILNKWVEENEKKVEDFEELYLMLLNGELPEGIQNGINKWMEENAFDIIGRLVKMVFFAVTSEGYFVAYIPESWDDIQFGTSGLDDFPEGVDFGHLTLSY